MSQMYYSPSWSSKFIHQLVVAESTRIGGVSVAPYASLNLGLYTPDSKTCVTENRRRFCEAIGCDVEKLAGLRQVHGSEVLRIHHPGQWEGYDAMITNKKGVILSVTIADCTPVLIYDPIQQAIGAVHAGWKGTVGDITTKTLLAMRDAYGSRIADCWVFIGTCIGADDFEVDTDVANAFTDDYKRWDEGKNKFLIDLKKANQEPLLQLGVPASQIEISPYSTIKNNDTYFSYRAEKGKTGRMLAVIGLK